LLAFPGSEGDQMPWGGVRSAAAERGSRDHDGGGPADALGQRFVSILSGRPRGVFGPPRQAPAVIQSGGRVEPHAQNGARLPRRQRLGQTGGNRVSDLFVCLFRGPATGRRAAVGLAGQIEKLSSNLEKKDTPSPRRANILLFRKSQDRSPVDGRFFPRPVKSSSPHPRCLARGPAYSLWALILRSPTGRLQTPALQCSPVS